MRQGHRTGEIRQVVAPGAYRDMGMQPSRWVLDAQEWDARERESSVQAVVDDRRRRSMPARE